MRLNGITPPVGTIMPGSLRTMMQPLVVEAVDKNGVDLRVATQTDYKLLAGRNPMRVNSVYEFRMIRRHNSPFGLIREMG